MILIERQSPLCSVSRIGSKPCVCDLVPTDRSDSDPYGDKLGSLHIVELIREGLRKQTESRTEAHIVHLPIKRVLIYRDGKPPRQLDPDVLLVRNRILELRRTGNWPSPKRKMKTENQNKAPPQHNPITDL